MTFATMILATMLAQAPVPALPAEAKVTYDKFHDYTSIKLHLSRSTDAAGTHVLSIYAHHKGKEPKAVEEVVFHVFKYSPHWEYLKYHDVVMMCGDDRLKLESNYDSEVDTKSETDHCDEFFSIHLSAEKLQATLKRDRDIEVKLGAHDSWPLRAECRRQMDAFVKAVRSGAY